MTYNPTSEAAENGFSGNREAINHADQVNQLLGAHDFTVIYPGTRIIAADPGGAGQHIFVTGGPPNQTDHSQPITMPVGKTSIGRVVIPLVWSGEGGDLKVTLCPDSAGSPDLNNPIVSTVVPKAWITNLGTQDSMTTDVPPLITTQYNGVSLQNNYTFGWSQPAVGPNGAASFATPVTNGNYMILLGGYDTVAATASGVVATVQTLGSGFIGNPALQPSIPKPAWYAMAAATSSSVWFAGGTNGVSFYSNVWGASWDPNTGTVGAWSAQASLPVPVIQGAGTSWGDYVYFMGGNADLTTASAYTTVYYALANNGQIQAWNTTTPLPQGLQLMGAAAINGWLVVCGGQTSAGTTSAKTYYAKIATDGSLGVWNTGPDMPVGVFTGAAQWTFAATESAMIACSGIISQGPDVYSTQFQSLPVMTNSVGSEWWSQEFGDTGFFQVAAFPHGEPGNWQLNLLKSSNYLAANTRVTPRISVPLPATGLTAGATYHVVIHNMHQSLADYTQLYAATDAVLATYLYRFPYTNGAWTAEANSRAIIIDVYDNAPGNDRPLHLWQAKNANADNQGMAASTYDWDYYGRLIGYCDSISMPQDPLNSNTLTTSTTSPWTTHGCTLTASTAQTHGGYSYSGLMTPDGVTAIVYVQSEQIRVTGGTGYQCQGWVYSALGHTVSLSINWYDANHAYISTSSNSVAVAAATWTRLTNNATAPSTAAYGTAVPTQGSTPSASDLLYMSYVTLTASDPDTLSSVAQVTYGSDPWPPTGITQLN